MAKRHRLTTRTDHLDGFSGKDLFLAPVNKHDKSTLSDKDSLNGRGGNDTVNAFLQADILTPKLRHIENGIFSRTSTNDMTLDLARARAMTSVTLNGFDADVTLAHAARLSRLAIANSSADVFHVNDVDSARVTAAKLVFNAADQTKVDFQNRNDLSFKTLDVHLKDSAVQLTGDIAVDKLTVHSIYVKDTDNSISVKPDLAGSTIHDVVADGTGELKFVGFTDLHSFNASAATGPISGNLGGANLTSLMLGAGADNITLTALGGAAGAPAKVDLGAGNDQLYLPQDFVPDAALHAFDGGAGVNDMVQIHAPLANYDAFKNFEQLQLMDASGIYDVGGTSFTYVDIYRSAPASNVTIDNLASGGKVDLNDDSTTGSTWINVAGASGLTDSLTLNLYGVKIGSDAVGFNAAGVSTLEIKSLQTGAAPLINKLALGELGAANDHASIVITGDTALTLSSTHVTRYISSITVVHDPKVVNDASINILGLADKENAIFGPSSSFAGDATITAGNGNDVLVGGKGNDTIVTGLGDNFVHSSLGADKITFGGGKDIFVINNQLQASGPNIDTINNFTLGTDQIDLQSFNISSIGFKGVFADLSNGKNSLDGNGQVQAFFTKDFDALYIDINGDGDIQSDDDVTVILMGLDSFLDTDFIL